MPRTKAARRHRWRWTSVINAETGRPVRVPARAIVADCAKPHVYWLDPAALARGEFRLFFYWIRK